MNSAELLKHKGLSTRSLQITLIAAWFNYINRMADALGVGRESASSKSAATWPGRVARLQDGV